MSQKLWFGRMRADPVEEPMAIDPVPAAADTETPPARGPFQLLPPLGIDEAAQLEASIRAHGVEDAVWVDEAGQTLDGHHRRAIAERLGIPYETRIVTGLSDAEKALLAIRRNTERRQLTKAQRVLVGMRAEPYFRAEAKARQGGRTDLAPGSTEPAQQKHRRVWAAEEAARTVAMPLSTYKRLKHLVLAAVRERSTEEVERAIEAGRWDMAEVAAVAAEQQAKADLARRRREEEEARKLAEAAWQTRDVLGRLRTPSDILGVDDGDALWRCHACDVYWPPTHEACGHCGVSRPVETDEAAADDPFAPRLVIGKALPSADDPREEDAAKIGAGGYHYVPRRPGIAARDAQHLRYVAGGAGGSFGFEFRNSPHELAAYVVEAWPSELVSELRQSVRDHLGWWAVFDAALSAAVAGEPAPPEDGDASPVETT
jgi:hypothetical protein